MSYVKAESTAPDDPRSRAKQVIQDAIHAMSEEKNEGFLKAVRKVPEIVNAEINYLRYLRFCDYNAWSAAEKICCYWQERLAIFGEDRGLRPLDMSGYGALTKDDVLTLQAGWPALLPPTKGGRVVCYVDRRQWLPTASQKEKLRSAFFMMHVLGSHDEETLAKGVVALFLATTENVKDFDRELLKKSMHLMMHAFAYPIEQHSLCFLPNNGITIGEKQAYFVQSVIASFVNIFVEENMKSEVHFEHEKGQIYQELLGLGLTRGGIPSDLGGRWHFLDATHWCRNRIMEDRKGYRKDRKKSGKRLKQSESADEDDESIASVTTDPGKRKKRRQIENIIHSRRKRERRIYEQHQMEQERDDLVNENKLLKKEFSRLSVLLERAQYVVNQQSTLTERTLHNEESVPLHNPLWRANEVDIARLIASFQNSDEATKQQVLRLLREGR